MSSPLTTLLTDEGLRIYQDGKDVTGKYAEWVEHTLNNPIFTWDGIEDLVEWIEKKYGIKVELSEYMKTKNWKDGE